MTETATTTAEATTLHLRDYGRVLSERRNVVFACLVLVVSFTALFTFLAHPVYKATATIQIERNTPEALNFGDMVASDYYDYQDLSTGLTSGQASMILGGVSALF